MLSILLWYMVTWKVLPSMGLHLLHFAFMVQEALCIMSWNSLLTDLFSHIIGFEVYSIFIFSCKLYESMIKYTNPTIFNIISWVAGSMGQTTHWPSVWCSKCYLFSYFLANWKNCFNLHIFVCHKNFMKIVLSFECLKSIKKYEKK